MKLVHQFGPFVFITVFPGIIIRHHFRINSGTNNKKTKKNSDMVHGEVNSFRAMRYSTDNQTSNMDKT